MSQQYQAEYETIDAAMRAGKPRTALDQARAFYDKALGAGDEDHALRALAYRAAFVTQTTEEGTDAKISLLRQELAKADGRPVLTSVINYLLGSTYHTYAQRNTYRLRNATAVSTDSVPAADQPLQDWTLAQLAAAAENHLYASLEQARSARTRLTAVPAIVTNDSARIEEYPTLYDLLARSALSTLGNPLLSVGDPAVATPEQFLGSAAAFVGTPLKMDPASGTYRKLKIYQELTNFHLGPPTPALLAIDLDRLAYVAQLGTDKSELRQAYQRMQGVYQNVPGGQRFLVREAELLTQANEAADLGERPKALALALLDRVTDTDPIVATPAAILRRQITATELSNSVASVYGKADNVLIKTNYRNVDRVYHRLYPTPPSGPDPNLSRWNLEEKAIAGVLKLRPLAKRDFKLATNDDYEQHTTETWLPAQKAGYYYLVTSTHPSFDLKKGHVSVTNFQVSNLAAVRHHDGEDFYFEIVNRTTGAPRSGVRVEIQQQSNRREDRWETINQVTTSTDGRVANPNVDRSSVRLILTDRANDDVLVTDATYSRNYRPTPPDPYPVTTLFTDRAIYRPGQTVKVYGLTWRKESDGLPTLLTGVGRELKLMDPNYQEVGSARVTSDEYSRFHTEFKLPEGGLTGSFTLQTDGGSIRIKMEEYKRPRFEVELTGPDYALAGEPTEITGTALLYAGPGVNDARVNYRVFLEEVSYWWWGRSGRNDKELVADGTTQTDDEGNFSFSFTPQPMADRGRKRFRFVVEADVADNTGETHEATTTVGLRGEKPVVALRPADELIDVTDSLTVLAAGADDNLTVSLTITPVTKPGVALNTRDWVFPDRPLLTAQDYQRHFPTLPSQGVTDLKEWPTAGTPVYNDQLTITDGEARLDLAARDWPVGHYRVDWLYPDGTAGEPSSFAVLDAAAAALPPGQRYHLAVSQRNATIGEPLTVTLVSAVSLPNVSTVWASRRGITRTGGVANPTLKVNYLPTEQDRGGIDLHLTFVSFGKVYTLRERINLGWDNKKLDINFATFRDKLRPGTPERWTLTIKNADGTPAMAAALASMYDASLDQITPATGWGVSPFPGYSYPSQRASLLTDGTASGNGQYWGKQPALQDVPALPALHPILNGNGYFGNLAGGPPRPMARRSRAAEGAMRKASGPPVPYSAAPAPEMAMEASLSFEADEAGSPPPPPPPPPGEATATDEAPVQIRTNLQETAFWFPELTSDQDGNLVIGFDSPEALTSWKFRLFAHDKAFASAVSEQIIVTQKELMVLPNVPRFVREGDEIGLTARVNNLTEGSMDVSVSLELFDPATGDPLAAELLQRMGAAAGAGQGKKEQSIGAGSGESVRFPLSIPEGLSERGLIGYRVIARGGSFSDGEENVIPVLTDRTLITVSQPFYLKNKDKKTLSLPELASNTSPTLRHVGYTFQATTNPAWLALKSLPYLMEYPYDCTEQLANRYFANQLAFATVSRKPILEQVFRQWQQDSSALQSELERNANLKNALLTETPWVRAAESEAQQRARIGDLFQLKRLADEQSAALDKLARRQEQSGYFSWFPGGRANRYMTQYVLETLARLRQLEVVTPDQQDRVASISQRAVSWLDEEIRQDYERLLERMKDEQDWEANYQPSSAMVHYLYARAGSGFDQSGNKAVAKALDFYAERAAAHWLSYGLYEQALLVVFDVRHNGKAGKLSQTIVASLRERALHQDEFGMYWKYGRGYRWQNLPIETHCRLLEAFQLAGGTTQELDDMRLWLLTNKRTNRWATTKSTAAAVFALLNAGTDWTDEAGQPLEVSWPDHSARSSLASRVRAAQSGAEAATGAFSVSVDPSEINPDLANVRLKNKNNRLVWGGVFWQYTELAQKVTASNDGPLTLERELFRRVPTEDGMRLDPITPDAPLAAGDRVTVRLILRSDRELDYVHLKDRRAATFEPIDQLSSYQYKNGLGYYMAPGDLATNFFIDHLPKGTYTLEYDLFATYSGSFSNGLGRVQCMYAPEFGANTDGARIVVE